MLYHKINNKDFNIKESIPAKPGVYRIIAIDKNGDPLEINRFLDSDQSGTLYIGKADNLHKRLSNMRRAFSASHKSIKHIAVRRINSIKRIKKQFSIDRLVISFELAEKGISAKQLEKQELELYERLMGERPPLNKQ